ncbi:diguanylate cyclase [Acetobacterium malicum]|uniref:diguanylate cyclase n=1 Tax=Acetobacterium malicum TaxID=52692 RepID=UPI00047C4CD1|nr:diguanylate cyclase [Acetobacterium dehalogenans]
MIEIIDELKMLNNESAGLVCERIRSRIEASQFADGLKITISGGVAEYQGEVVPAFIDSADKNRYEAKNSGRNRIAVKQDSPSPIWVFLMTLFNILVNSLICSQRNSDGQSFYLDERGSGIG